MFGKHFGQVGVLTLLTVITFASVDYQKAFFADPVVAYANQTAAVATPVVNQSPVVVAEDTTVACPVGYICTPNPKVSISSVVMNGPNPQVVSYRFNLAGVDRLELYLSANGSNNPIQNFSAIVHGTKSNNALGKTVLNTKGHSIAEFLVDFSNKTGKDVAVGIKAIGYSKNKQVGADGDAITIFANPTKPFCPMGYTCEPLPQSSLYKINIVTPSSGQVLVTRMQYKLIWDVGGSGLSKDTLFDVVLFDDNGKGLIGESIPASSCQLTNTVLNTYRCIIGWTPEKVSNSAKVGVFVRNTSYGKYSDKFTISSTTPTATVTPSELKKTIRLGESFDQKFVINNIKDGVVFDSWSIVKGELPPGVSLTKNGVFSALLSGTPKIPGDYSFLIQGGSTKDGLNVWVPVYLIVTEFN